MTDPVLALLWAGILAVGVGIVVVAHARGLSANHARDALHVGAGVWVLGWPWWDGLIAPLGLVGAAVVVTGLVPTAAARVPGVDRFRRSVVARDEDFRGLVLYTVSFAVMTWVGLAHRPFPAAAALLALALGDGVGGLVGRRFGRRSYSTPLGKRKSLEGSAAVAVCAAVGVVASTVLFHVELGAGAVLVLALVAAGAEGLAPRGADNIAVPAAVWVAAELIL